MGERQGTSASTRPKEKGLRANDGRGPNDRGKGRSLKVRDQREATLTDQKGRPLRGKKREGHLTEGGPFIVYSARKKREEGKLCVTHCQGVMVPNTRRFMQGTPEVRPDGNARRMGDPFRYPKVKNPFSWLRPTEEEVPSEAGNKISPAQIKSGVNRKNLRGGANTKELTAKAKFRTRKLTNCQKVSQNKMVRPGKKPGANQRGSDSNDGTKENLSQKTGKSTLRQRTERGGTIMNLRRGKRRWWEGKLASFGRSTFVTKVKQVQLPMRTRDVKNTLRKRAEIKRMNASLESGAKKKRLNGKANTRRKKLSSARTFEKKKA